VPSPELEAYRRQFEQDWETALADILDEAGPQPPLADVEAYRRQFEEEWADISRGIIEEVEAETVVARTGHPGQPPLYARDPAYVAPDELPPGNVSPDYDQLTAFLYGGHWLNVTSSNVAAIQYLDQERILYIQYLDGSIYGYTDVSHDEAIDFATAPSKGRWRHQNLPPSRANYWHVSGPPRNPMRFYAERERGMRGMTQKQLLAGPAKAVEMSMQREPTFQRRSYRPAGF